MAAPMLSSRYNHFPHSITADLMDSLGGKPSAVTKWSCSGSVVGLIYILVVFVRSKCLLTDCYSAT